MASAVLFHLNGLAECSGSMALGNTSDYLAGHDVESRVQTRRTMAFVIMRPAFNLTWA